MERKGMRTKVEESCRQNLWHRRATVLYTKHYAIEGSHRGWHREKHTHRDLHEDTDMSINDVSCDYHFLLMASSEYCLPLTAKTRHEGSTHGEAMLSTQSEGITVDLCSIRGL